MLRYLVRRLGWAALLFLAITIVTYVIFFVIPTEPTRVGRGRAAEPIDLRTAVTIDGPIYEEYGEFLWKIANGSLGESFVTRRPVGDVIKEAAPVTMSLVFGGVLLWMLLAIPIGLASALRPRSLVDRAGTLFVLIGISAHPVWIGLILAYFFGQTLGVMPLAGYCDVINPSTRCGGPLQWAWHLVLPWTTFAIMFAAIYMRMIRASVLEAMSEDYVRTARAKGAPEWIVMRSHVLRNAMLPIVTMVGMDVGMALGGTVFVERVYGLPGLGGVALQSLGRRDLPVILGIVVFTTLAVIVFNLIVDLLYAWIDPRSRLTVSDHEGTVRRGARAQTVPTKSVSQPA